MDLNTVKESYNFYNFCKYNFVNYCTFQATLRELGSDKSPALVTNPKHIIGIKL